jgi:uncharacterized protein (TIGR02266 family)
MSDSRASFEDKVAPYRRSAPRVPLETEVSFHSETQIFVGLSGDISQGGIFLSTYQNIPIGTEVHLKFTLPNGAVEAMGTVRWTRPQTEGGEPPGVGISFEGLGNEARSLIEQFCRARPPLYHDLDDV